jgi:diamine N-acetyltransferase
LIQKNNRSGIGIVIQGFENRETKMLVQALDLLIRYAFYHLNVPPITQISTGNKPSIALLLNLVISKCIGIKKKD